MRTDAFTRSWIELEEDRGLGYGVTAADEADALALLRQRVITGREMPAVRRIEPGIDLSTLDQDHVLPNAGPPVWRGVWFPNLGPEST